MKGRTSRPFFKARIIQINCGYGNRKRISI
jgi:hypothetical protein